MFLSIIIPVYNAERYLGECLDSLLNQDIPLEEYEIICIDDGSTDNSGDMLRKYAANHPNIVLIQQKNAGVSAARNTGMDIATGSYFWFVDADDFVRPNSLGKLKTLCDNVECDILSFRLYYFDDAEADALRKKLNGAEKIASNSSIRSQQSMLISRKLIGDLRWRTGIEVGEDSIFLRELTLKQYSKYEIEDTIYFYRQQPSSAIHTTILTKERMFSHINGAIIAKGLYEAPNGANEANANLLRMFVIYAMVAIARYKGEEKIEALNMMQKAKLFPFKTPREATSKNNFHTTRSDLLGKCYGFLCCHSGTRTGYFALCVWYKLFNMIRG